MEKYRVAVTLPPLQSKSTSISLEPGSTNISPATQPLSNGSSEVQTSESANEHVAHEHLRKEFIAEQLQDNAESFVRGTADETKSNATTVTEDSSSSSAAVNVFKQAAFQSSNKGNPKPSVSSTPPPAQFAKGENAMVRRGSRRHSQSSKKKEPRLTKNYSELVRGFTVLRPYSKQPDGSYPPDTKCVFCEVNQPVAVFFPCQHRCVCDSCILHHNISTDLSKRSSWCACPVCMGEIRLILPHTGNEEDLYWQWVLEVQPVLPSYFKQEFRDTARRLRRNSIAPSCPSTHVQSSDQPPRARPLVNSCATKMCVIL